VQLDRLAALWTQTCCACSPSRAARSSSWHAALVTERAAVAADVAQLEASGQMQLLRTDPGARLLTKTGQSVAGYHVQIAVEAKHRLIVAAEAVRDGNDTGQLHAKTQAARDAMAVDKRQAVADIGSYKGETLKACEEAGIEVFGPEPDRSKRLARRAGSLWTPSTTIPTRMSFAARPVRCWRRWAVAARTRPERCVSSMPPAARFARAARCGRNASPPREAGESSSGTGCVWRALAT
jgi:hypothetical protein